MITGTSGISVTSGATGRTGTTGGVMGATGTTGNTVATTQEPDLLEAVALASIAYRPGDDAVTHYIKTAYLALVRDVRWDFIDDAATRAMTVAARGTGFSSLESNDRATFRATLCAVAAQLSTQRTSRALRRTGAQDSYTGGHERMELMRTHGIPEWRRRDLARHP
jgi:hypothetical protein